MSVTVAISHCVISSYLSLQSTSVITFKYSFVRNTDNDRLIFKDINTVASYGRGL